MNSSSSRSNGAFATGFISALIFVAVLVGAARAAQWIGTHPMPEAVMAWLSAPRISVLGLINIAVLLVMGYSVIWAAAYGPRMR